MVDYNVTAARLTLDCKMRSQTPPKTNEGMKEKKTTRRVRTMLYESR